MHLLNVILITKYGNLIHLMTCGGERQHSLIADIATAHMTLPTSHLIWKLCLNNCRLDQLAMEIVPGIDRKSCYSFFVALIDDCYMRQIQRMGIADILADCYYWCLLSNLNHSGERRQLHVRRWPYDLVVVQCVQELQSLRPLQFQRDCDCCFWAAHILGQGQAHEYQKR